MARKKDVRGNGTQPGNNSDRRGSPGRGNATGPARAGGKPGAPGKNAARARDRNSGRRSEAPGGGRYWLYGQHAVQAALANPERRIQRLVATAEAAADLTTPLATARAQLPDLEILDRQSLSDLLPEDAVHQGQACLCAPLPEKAIEDLAPLIRDDPRARLLLLDQVTDPRNVGAILRSAAAFGALAVLVQDRHAPPITGALARAASGALELVPVIRVVNLARALEYLRSLDVWSLGLDGHAERSLAGAAPEGRVALVMGAEGDGMRRLTRENCDMLVRLPMQPGIESLNVSVAAAISLYELARNDPDPLE